MNYLYLVSEKKQHEVKLKYHVFTLCGDSADEYCNSNNVSESLFLKERVIELDEYINPYFNSRNTPENSYLVEKLFNNVWLVEGYMHCEKSTQDFVTKYPLTRRFTKINMHH